MDIGSIFSKETLAKITSAAPMIGGLFGGPPGAAVGAVIKMAASALGVEDTPQAIEAAISADPQALLKLKELELNNNLELQRLLITATTARIAEETKQIQAVNETMQAESKSEHWPQYSWRPFWGFVSGAAFFAVCCLVSWLAFDAVQSKDMNAINMIPQIIFAFTALFGVPGAILGIASFQRGRMQREVAGCGQAGKVVPS